MDKKQALIKFWKQYGYVSNNEIIKAFIEIKRENFVLEEYKDQAYRDYPLFIGFGQTISQPTTIMIMLEALKVKPENIVLEIGAGSGYNAALISKLCRKVYAIEKIEKLCDFAKKNLKKSKINNVKVICSDGTLGYENAAPYDRIIITAATPEIPKPLIKQLKLGGILVAPVGSLSEQKMIRLLKTDKELKIIELGSFRFVPLKGKHGF